jgi:glycine/D-amino acid oxidase-like deaminating enzyme
LSVAVFEAGRVGCGASGRTGGIVLEDTAQGRLPATENCIDSLQHLLRETGIECHLDLPGCWELTHEGGGEPLWRDGDQEIAVQATVPGGTLDPGKLLAGLAHAAQQEGATLHEEAPVRCISGGSPLTLQVADTEVRADHAVLGLNAYTPALVAPGEDFHPALTLALCTRPLAPGTLERIGIRNRTPFYTLDLPYLWGRPLCSQEADRLIFGGGLAFDATGQVQRIDLASAEAAGNLARLEERVRGLHPALASVAIERRWGGPVAFRARRGPILSRHPARPGLILTGAYAGHGLALSLRMGELAARILLREADPPAWGALERPSETRDVG